MYMHFYQHLFDGMAEPTLNVKFSLCYRYVLVACHNVVSRKHDGTFYKITRNFYDGFFWV